MRYVLTILFSLIVLGLNAQEKDPSQVFFSFEEKSIDTRELLSIAKARTNGAVYMTLDKWDLELENSRILASDYRFIDQNGNQLTDKQSRAIPLNGYTKAGGRVSLTIGDGFLYGYIEDGEDLFYIEPSRYYRDTRNRDQFIIYNTKDIKPEAAMQCGFDADQHKANEFNDREKDDSSSRMAGLCYDVEYAIMNDWSMFDKYGAAGLESRNIGITNNVNTDYSGSFSDDVIFVITGQYNITSSTGNPFVINTDLSGTLGRFRTWGNSNLSNPNSNLYIRNDVASLWSDVFPNSGTVGVAYVGVICGSSRYNVLSDLSTNANTLRVLVSHEIGHNFNANHDASGSGFIMAPSVNNTSTWSPASISSISNHIDTRTCLETCSDLPPTVFFESSDFSVVEQAGSSNGGDCQLPYVDYFLQLSISKGPTNNVVVGINSSGSTATLNSDFELVTPSITFTPSGNLTRNITLRIFDDAVVEGTEEIDINFTINSGDAEAASSNTLTIDLVSDDEIETADGGEGGLFTYGSSYSAVTNDGIFAGNRTDSRSRFLLSANYMLNTLNMSAGEIDMIGFWVHSKNSNGTFNDFRISMKSTTQSDLGQVSWGGGSQVFIGDVSTVEGAFNVMEFSEPYVWDGTSNIYVEMCFNNSTTIGFDQVALFDAGVSNSGQQFSWSTNTINNCSSVTNWSFFYDLQPNVLLRVKGATEAETVLAATGNTNLRVGETANIFSDEGRIIASITNTGNTDLDCVDATVQTAGLGRLNVPFTSGQYTNKSIRIETDANGSYELTLYFTDEELAVWQSDNHSLNFLRSTGPINNSTSGNSEFLASSNVNTEIGAENVVAYTTTVSGPGYFALSDASLIPAVTANVSGTFENADVLIEEFGKGLLLKNSLGQQYLLSVNATGDPVLTEDNSSTGSSFLPTGDLCIISPGKSLMIKRNASSFSKISINNDGSIVTSNTSSLPSQRLTLTSGHFGLVDVGSGVIFQNMENECYKLFVDDNGLLKVGTVPCL